MPFHHATKPALRLPFNRLKSLVASLLKAGYDEHDGRKLEDKREIATFRKRYASRGQNRQCHVQILYQDEKNLDVFAHVEPVMGGISDIISHGMSALTDGADFVAGTRMLCEDLKKDRRVSSAVHRKTR